MNYIKFNIDSWQRKEYYDVYNQLMNCSFSLTTKIDITNLKKHIDLKGYRFPPR